MLLQLYLNTLLFPYWAQEIQKHMSLSYKLWSQQAEFLSCYTAYAMFSHTSYAPLACSFKID